MADIVWPINTAPGYRSQDGSGRLINVYAEPRQNQQGVVYRRAPGAEVVTTIYASTGRWTGTGTVIFGGTFV
jgi:hypothetical protein